MYLLALKLGLIRGTIDATRAETLLQQVRDLPDLARRTLARRELVEPIADQYHANEFFLYLGRNMGLPIALEGALKLKEISYIATDAYAAGEMKHGPIALLDDRTPVVVIATDSHVYEKVVSNIQEVRARGAHVIAVATEGNESIRDLAEHVLYLPRTEPELQAALAVLPLQQLAYAIATGAGSTSTSRGTWPRPSRSSSALRSGSKRDSKDSPRSRFGWNSAFEPSDMRSSGSSSRASRIRVLTCGTIGTFQSVRRTGGHT